MMSPVEHTCTPGATAPMPSSGLPGAPSFLRDHHVEGRVEGPRDLGGDDDAPSGHSEHDDRRLHRTGEHVPEPAAGIDAIDEHEPRSCALRAPLVHG